jgi:hypothetical protein
MCFQRKNPDAIVIKSSNPFIQKDYPFYSKGLSLLLKRIIRFAQKG